MKYRFKLELKKLLLLKSIS